MDRREVLRYTALITGGALSAPLVEALLSGCSTRREASYLPQFFSEENFTRVRELINLALPGKPGPPALQMGVDQTIDHMMAKVYRKDFRETFQKNFEAFQEWLTEQDFDARDETEQLALLRELEQDEVEAVKPAREGLKTTKQQAVAYYLTSEEVAKNFLNYLPVPGEYEGCIALEDVGGKAWAL